MEREALQKLIENLGLGDQVKLLGRLSEQDLETQMKSHHGMVLPTKSLEGFGMSVIEAFEAGLPVLATKVAALTEFEKHDGAFYAIAEPEVEEIAEGIKHVCDPWKKVEERTKACRQVAETYYSHEIMRQKLIGLYRDLK
jgi:glycosyltransferase involved in cell wall biosynthesis